MILKRTFYALAFSFLLFAQSEAQKVNESFRYYIQKTDFPIIVDGRLDEPGWHNADVATDFFMITPMDTSYAELKTEVRMTYDSENLYIAVENYRSEEGVENVVESLRRDFNFGSNDNFLLAMDPFDDQTNGFSFGANAAGAEWDGMMYDGGRMNLSWDNKWSSSVRNYPDRWVFEAAIPFKSIRYNENRTEWGINFSRYDLTNFEKSGWAPVPRQFPSVSLAYTGTLVWETPPPSAGSNISVIPHVLGGINHDFDKEDARSYERDAGLNAKVGLSSSMNLDLTLNPDFSQVEVDEQIVDLDRFELFFPERRQFFIENEDLFASFGNRNIRPFFSRRIGLQAPILFGGRLSGQLNRDWRIGVMNMQTGEAEAPSLPNQNFTVIALKRRVAARSNIGFLLVNQESFFDDPQNGPAITGEPEFDRNVGVEYNLASANDLWQGKFMALKSFRPGDDGRSISHIGNLEYSDGNLTAEWLHEYVGEDYTAEVGFVPRRGYIRLNPELQYLFFPSGGKILSHGPTLETDLYFDRDFTNTDYENLLIYQFNLRGGAGFLVAAGPTYVKLFQPFDPTNSLGFTLDAGTEHRWYTFGTEFGSSARRSFTYSGAIQYGGFYADGTRLSLRGDIGYRFQPYVNISLDARYNNLELPQPWGNYDFWLIGSRIDVTFTKDLYLTSFTQYNEQQDNVNINTRLQWRFQPASDLFVVYTDNYLPGSFGVKNRAILLKLTYWWNV